MAVVRVVVLVLLVATIVCFALHAVTGAAHWRRRGLVILKWTVVSGLAFFAVLALERLVRMV